MTALSLSSLSILALMLLFHAWLLAADHFSEALLGLKSEIVDDSNSLSDWSVGFRESSTSKITACSWSGVACTDSMTKITGLDLSSRTLSGSISGKYISKLVDLVDLKLSQNVFSGQLPAEIFSLANLRSLDIGRNNFSGSFPSGISSVKNLVVLDAFSNSFSGPLPPEVASLDSLKVLNLAGSYFEGPIPPEYGNFKLLEFLHLAGNLLDSEIPPELGNLQTVSHMEIGYNNYRGSIPSQIGNMSALQYLDIAQANLSGSIPADLANLTQLQSLYLFRNSLTGSIPPSLGDVKSLTNLDLSDNLLTGSIPTSFSNLQNLRLLSLMYNYMTGPIPEGIAELPSLDTLLIWTNLFTGSLPQNLGQNSQLKWLDVSTNNFTGLVPPGLCRGGKLFKLILFSNKFTTGLSSVLSNCSSLIRIRVEDNLFSGPFPVQFSLLSNINYVDLSRNNFTDGIPLQILEALKLEYFNVSKNSNLGGSIPDKIWSLPQLQNFSASSCSISGNVPSFESCRSITWIDLQLNNLSGSLAKSISHCKFLQRVDLANNTLTGQIPRELAGLPSLSIVDLSHNKLTGAIPLELVNSTKLALLNVSFNGISGTIPSGEKFQFMGPSAFIGNPLLCGAPLQPCTTSPRVAGKNTKTGSCEKIIWILSLCLGIISGLVCAVWYIYRRYKASCEVVSFRGLPQFKAKDILRSMKDNHYFETDHPLLVLPTGITVSVRKIEWDCKTRRIISEFITILGNARHMNLMRLLGFCSNDNGVYLLYDHLPNGNLKENLRNEQYSKINTWPAKYRIVIGVAKGLCHLHHHCCPPIPHGDLSPTNIVFDENMEPQLAECGVKYLIEPSGGLLLENIIDSGRDKMELELREEFFSDIYSFGEVLLEILTNGGLTNGGKVMPSLLREATLNEICNNYEGDLTDAQREEIRLVFQLAMKCTRSPPSDRPSMEEMLKLFVKTENKQG